MRTDALITFLTALAIPASAFWRMPCPGRLVDERADPIVSPGVVSGHVHSIAGGNGFGFEMTYEQARASECSSCPIKQDLSNYWTPKLYYHAQNGSFISVPQAGDGNGVMGGMTVYYLQRPGPNNDKLHAFPEGFRMLAGDPFVRNYTGTFAAQAVSYACLNYNGPATPQTNALPDTNCPDGVRAQVFFPSCWDGKNLDSPNHQSHVSYPESGAYNSGPCPASHPVHLISIFYEVIYQTNLFANDWYGDRQPFVFAMGDPLGYGFHGDFINGWNVSALQYAVDNCNNDSGNIADCLSPSGGQHFELFSNQESQSCILPSFVDEEVEGVLHKLPGCNSLTYGPGEAPIASCPVTPLSQIPFQQYFTDVTKSLDYAYIGCGTDNVASRTFAGASESSNSMTVQSCVEFCHSKGFKYAGLEYSSQCYCDNTLEASRAPLPGVMGDCMMPCAGNSKQFCGGAATMSIYESCTGKSSCTNVQIGSTHVTATTSTVSKRIAEPKAEADAEVSVKRASLAQRRHVRMSHNANMRPRWMG